MKVKIRKTGEILEITEVLVNNPIYVSPQRMDVKDVEFLAVEFIKYSKE